MKKFFFFVIILTSFTIKVNGQSTNDLRKLEQKLNYCLDNSRSTYVCAATYYQDLDDLLNKVYKVGIASKLNNAEGEEADRNKAWEIGKIACWG